MYKIMIIGFIEIYEEFMRNYVIIIKNGCSLIAVDFLTRQKTLVQN